MKKINGKYLKYLFMKGTENLLLHKDEINALNVFPVPDGDTGSNMSATMLEGCKYLESLDNETMDNVLDSIKNGTLMGARGNSGVILSQIFRGFTDALKGKIEVGVKDFAFAFKSAKEVSYGAVMKPVEGTILTAIRYLAENVEVLSEQKDFISFFEEVLSILDKAVKDTPNMLKKLKDAGVVDAGAKGLYYIAEGFSKYINGDTKIDLNIKTTSIPVEEIQMIPEDLKFQYCTELIVRTFESLSSNEENEIRSFLHEIGDSVVFFIQDNIVKLHVHTNNPGNVIEKLLTKGELLKVKIDNMKEQHEHFIEKEKEIEKKKNGVVAVSPSDGISKILRDLGVDEVVIGGQTMNPSTADLKVAVESVNAENIFVFPNNSNIILAAKQVAETVKDKNVYVVETKNVQECIASMIKNNPEEDPEKLLGIFNEVISEVDTISITRAVRNAKLLGEKIKKDEYLVFLNNKFVEHNFDFNEVLSKTFEKIDDIDKKEIITLIVGKEATPIEINIFERFINKKYPDLEIEMYEGGQVHYPFLVLIE
ncbi:DAK2 domain fusion protein YloV [Thermosipho melanesiensis]|uniref:Dak phosphatase n=2 Tax=Thermosipho melanesiensis TaxID=46541 RepID=A6LJM3_THEM4|nr:DAK2 domain-containing protein [Thermosipho melanesiensis]ABR30124.1 Dak phosphatase [Thermosipho melanesiensis BI429]APT73321.1 DAK2 domain fusion protein YloV [Thermosipho melanesiensis]OOC38711.1 DAK2 domain fusion protein YloV [Thermosipho melanesiensis]OOC40515.1 DAK2 domain fusion protein YloV [Thermosipho melanesiensis]OOC40780.1 DAK2 domain fusion protein YloV [Thermosipho melanesiensis]